MRHLLFVIMVLLSAPVYAADVIVLTIDEKSTEHFGDKAQKGGKKLPPMKTAQVKSTVTLGDDSLVVKADKGESIYDFKSRKMMAVDHGQKTYQMLSLYAVPAFKLYEKKNQELLFLKMPKEVGFSIGNLRPFDVESMFGAAKGSTIAAQISDRMDGAVRRFNFDGAEVASYSLSSVAVPVDKKDEYARYFAHKQSLHPAIVEKALAEGRFLSALSHTHNAVLPEKVDYAASMEAAAATAEIDMAAPQGYRRVYASNKKLDEIIRRSMTEKERSPDDYAAAMKLALDKGDNAGVIMLFMEYAVQYGTDGVENMTGFVKAAMDQDNAKGAKMAPVIAAMRSNPQSKEEAEKAIAILEEARTKNYTHGYIINVFLGNIYGAVRQNGKAADLITEALEKNPFLVGAYKDLGDKLLTAYETPDAWACWDRMREIRPGHTLATGVTDFEKRLAADFPQYF